MTTLKVLFALSCLTLAVSADEYCYYDSYNNIVCRNRLSTGARIAIAVTSFVVISAILLAFTMRRRRRTAQANMAFVHASQNQQQGYPNQYPLQNQGDSFGNQFGGNAQKPQSGYDQSTPQNTGQPQYNAQPDPQYNGQYNPHYNGQYQTQYSPPQYPPAAYDQGNPTSPAPPYSGYVPPQR